MVRTFNYPSLTFFFLDHGFYFHASLKALQVFYYILDIVEKAVDYSSIIYLSIYKTIIHCYDHCFFIKQWPFIFIFKKLYFLLLFIPVFTYWLSYVLSLNNFFWNFLQWKSATHKFSKQFPVWRCLYFVFIFEGYVFLYSESYVDSLFFLSFSTLKLSFNNTWSPLFQIRNQQLFSFSPMLSIITPRLSLSPSLFLWFQQIDYNVPRLHRTPT